MLTALARIDRAFAEDAGPDERDRQYCLEQVDKILRAAIDQDGGEQR
ncbi:hypothetical protein ACQP2U_43570 (plasmid) [Nocardia sp. CA-084685]